MEFKDLTLVHYDQEKNGDYGNISIIKGDDRKDEHLSGCGCCNSPTVSKDFFELLKRSGVKMENYFDE